MYMSSGMLSLSQTVIRLNVPKAKLIAFGGEGDRNLLFLCILAGIAVIQHFMLSDYHIKVNRLPTSKKEYTLSW